MLQYITVNKYKHTKKLYRLWNGDFHSTFPIKKTFFKDIILNDANLNEDASFVALYENEPVGFIFVKTWLQDSGFANEYETAHISLIYVKKEMRNMGIGSDMLNLAITEVKKHKHIKKLVVGNEINKVFSGIPNEFVGAPIFFMNKGFVQKEGVVDMIRVARAKSLDNIDTKSLEIRIATEEEKDEILQLCVANEWKREGYLLNQYFEKGGSGRRIAIGLLDGKIVALSRFNDENKLPMKMNAFMNDKILGCILFVKVDKAYEDRGFVEVMNDVTKNYLIKRGCKKFIVLATKDIQFYKKLGYSAFKYYLQFEIDL